MGLIETWVPSDIIARLRGYRGAELTCGDDDPIPEYFLDVGGGSSFNILHISHFPLNVESLLV